MTNVSVSDDESDFENQTESHEPEREDESADLDTSFERPKFENDNTDTKVPSVQQEKPEILTISKSLIVKRS